MDYTEIEAAALELEKEDRVALLEAITDSLREALQEDKDPTPVIAQVEAAAGRDLLLVGRFPQQVAMRCAIAYRLRYEMHLTTKEIGRAIARDHSTVLYYIARMDAALKTPKMWPEYYEIYNKSKTL